MASLRKTKPLTRSESKRGRRLTPALEKHRKTSIKPAASACIQLTFESPTKKNQIASPEIKITGCNSEQLSQIFLAVSPILNPHSPLSSSPSKAPSELTPLSPTPSSSQSPYRPAKFIPLSPIPSSPSSTTSAVPTGNSIALDDSYDSYEELMNSLHVNSIRENDTNASECAVKNDNDRVREVFSHYLNLSREYNTDSLREKEQNDSELDYDYSCQVTNTFSVLNCVPDQAGIQDRQTPPARTPSSRPPCNKNKGRNVGDAFKKPAKKSTPSTTPSQSVIRMSPADLSGCVKVPLDFGKHAERQVSVPGNSGVKDVTRTVCEKEKCVNENVVVNLDGSCDEKSDTVESVTSQSVEPGLSTAPPPTAPSPSLITESYPITAPPMITVPSPITAPSPTGAPPPPPFALPLPNTAPGGLTAPAPPVSPITFFVEDQTRDDFVPSRKRTAPVKIRAGTRLKKISDSLRQATGGNGVSPTSPVKAPCSSDCSVNVKMSENAKSGKKNDIGPVRSATDKHRTADRVRVTSMEAIAARAVEDQKLEGNDDVQNTPPT